MKSMVKALMSIQGITLEEAETMADEIRQEIDDTILNGGGIDDTYDVLSLYGLEPDYLVDALGY